MERLNFRGVKGMELLIRFQVRVPFNPDTSHKKAELYLDVEAMATVALFVIRKD